MGGTPPAVRAQDRQAACRGLPSLCLAALQSMRTSLGRPTPTAAFFATTPSMGRRNPFADTPMLEEVMRSHLMALCCATLSLGFADVVRSQPSTTTNATVKVGGSVWYHSTNLLQNPDASSSTVTPPWTQSSGTWTVTTGPTTLGSQSINSSDGSPWFRNSQTTSLSCGTCVSTRTVTLVQTVNFNGNFFQTNQAAIEYGGDAFAVGMTVTGNGNTGYYYASEGYEATYRLDFLDSSGNQLAFDASGPIFNSVFGCPLLHPLKKNYGYRRTVGVNLPTATRSIRFTASMMDKLTVCNNYGTTGTFRNGFDKLWLVLWFSGPPTISGRFERGSGPGPIVKATVTPKPTVSRPRQ